MLFAKNTNSNYLWINIIKLGLKSPLLTETWWDLGSREKSMANAGLEVSIQKIEELALHGSSAQNSF